MIFQECTRNKSAVTPKHPRSALRAHQAWCRPLALGVDRAKPLLAVFTCPQLPVTAAVGIVTVPKDGMYLSAWESDPPVPGAGGTGTKPQG